MVVIKIRSCTNDCCGIHSEEQTTDVCRICREPVREQEFIDWRTVNLYQNDFVVGNVTFGPPTNNYPYPTPEEVKNILHSNKEEAEFLALKQKLYDIIVKWRDENKVTSTSVETRISWSPSIDDECKLVVNRLLDIVGYYKEDKDVEEV